MTEQPKPLLSQLYSIEVSGFPIKDAEWDKSTPEQREEWKQGAIEGDKEIHAILKQIGEQHSIVFNALKVIYGDKTNYKGKPIGERSKTYHRIKKYLTNDRNNPYQRQWSNYYLNLWERYNTSYEKRQVEIRKQQEQQERNKQLRQDEIERIKTLTEICIRHDIDTDFVPEVYEIQSQLEAKNKYLALAMGGLRNRQSWVDGYSHAESAFNSFETVSETDKEIVADWQKIFDMYAEGEVDGRYFRDTEWNYNRLFELVEDAQLVKDTMALEDMQERF